LMNQPNLEGVSQLLCPLNVGRLQAAGVHAFCFLSIKSVVLLHAMRT
jgi:hypothetical protein